MMAEQQIAIMGAGMVGSYLYRLLHNKGADVTIFNDPIKTKCGVHPCAWGTSNGFHELVKETGLDPEKYILKEPEYLVMDAVKVMADLITFDKPRMIHDLLRGASLTHPTPDISEYDRIIDTTGVARAYLPPIKDDAILECVQYRVTSSKPLENRMKYGNVGYAWTFPLSGQTYHVGCGCFTAESHTMLKDLGWMEGCEVICGCSAWIRLTAPKGSMPFVHGNVWGAGEAIGCVSPIAGDGIVTGMKSAQIMLQNWNDPVAYTRAILNEFAWMESERALIDKLRQGKWPSVKDAMLLKKNSERMGMKIRIKDAMALLRGLLHDI